MERLQRKLLEIQRKLANAHDEECEGSSAFGVYVNREEAELYLDVKKCMRVVEPKDYMMPGYLEGTERDWAWKLAKIWLVCIDGKLKSTLRNMDEHQVHAEDQESTCPICYEKLSSEPVGNGDDETEIATGVTAMACLHKFHGMCLERWLECSIYKNCPVCRQPAVVEEHYADVLLLPDYATLVRKSLQDFLT